MEKVIAKRERTLQGEDLRIGEGYKVGAMAYKVQSEEKEGLIRW